MSYRGIGQVEIDFTRGDPYIYPPPMTRTTYVQTEPPTDAQTAAGLVIGIAVIGLIGLAIWKAPRGAWAPAPYYRQPAVRIRMNKRRRRSRRRTRR